MGDTQLKKFKVIMIIISSSILSKPLMFFENVYFCSYSYVFVHGNILSLLYTYFSELKKTRIECLA